MPKWISFEEAAQLIPHGARIMVGGFMGCGSPHKLLNVLSKLKIGDLTIICNDGSMTNGPDGSDFYGVAKLIHNKQVKKLIVSHVGLNPEVSRRIHTAIIDDKLECILVPQGTLAERIRAGGAGLGGILTPTGVGTIAAEGKQLITVDGREYLLEKPLHAEYALIRASKTDKFGNMVFYGTTRNFNPLMAAAADYVIAGACEIVETGEIDPNHIHVSGIFINAIVGGEKPWKI
jgi:acetate CoA/acetoacetate CoA-transferase alpha subunit